RGEAVGRRVIHLRLDAPCNQNPSVRKQGSSGWSIEETCECPVPGGPITGRREGSSGRIVKFCCPRFIATHAENSAVPQQGGSVVRAGRGHLAGGDEHARRLGRRCWDVADCRYEQDQSHQKECCHSLMHPLHFSPLTCLTLNAKHRLHFRYPFAWGTL